MKVNSTHWKSNAKRFKYLPNHIQKRRDDKMFEILVITYDGSLYTKYYFKKFE